MPEPTIKKGSKVTPRKRTKRGRWRKKRSDAGVKRSYKEMATIRKILQTRDLQRILPVHIEHQQLYEKHQVTPLPMNLRELDAISDALEILLGLQQSFSISKTSRDYVWQLWQKINKIKLREIKAEIKMLKMRRNNDEC